MSITSQIDTKMKTVYDNITKLYNIKLICNFELKEKFVIIESRTFDLSSNGLYH